MSMWLCFGVVLWWYSIPESSALCPEKSVASLRWIRGRGRSLGTRARAVLKLSLFGMIGGYADCYFLAFAGLVFANGGKLVGFVVWFFFFLPLTWRLFTSKSFWRLFVVFFLIELSRFVFFFSSAERACGDGLCWSEAPERPSQEKKGH